MNEREEVFTDEERQAIMVAVTRALVVTRDDGHPSRAHDCYLSIIKKIGGVDKQLFVRTLA